MYLEETFVTFCCDESRSALPRWGLARGSGKWMVVVVLLQSFGWVERKYLGELVEVISDQQ